MSNAGLCRIERHERCHNGVVPYLFGIIELSLPFDFSSSITAFYIRKDCRRSGSVNGAIAVIVGEAVETTLTI